MTSLQCCATAAAVVRLGIATGSTVARRGSPQRLAEGRGSMRYTLRATLCVLAISFVTAVMPSSVAGMDEQSAVVQIAYAHIGDRFKIGASGPTRFDCSGFVWFTFKSAGLADRIGGKPVRARDFQKYFRER